MAVIPLRMSDDNLTFCESFELGEGAALQWDIWPSETDVTVLSIVCQVTEGKAFLRVTFLFTSIETRDRFFRSDKRATLRVVK